MSARISARIFIPGGLLLPIRGTARYVNGEAVGFWGDDDHPVCLLVHERDGALRRLTPGEHRLLRRVSPQMFKGVDQ
jgi:hypothetical protein